jgi:hypothetical protein
MYDDSKFPLHGEWVPDERWPEVAQGFLDARARSIRPLPRRRTPAGLTAAARFVLTVRHPVVGTEDEHTKEREGGSAHT